MTTATAPKSRKATVSILASAGFNPQVDGWGNVTFSTAENCRCVVVTRGPRRSPSAIQVFSTVKCPPEKRLAESFRLAKQVAKTLHFPVCFSAAGRSISGTINPL